LQPSEHDVVSGQELDQACAAGKVPADVLPGVDANGNEEHEDAPNLQLESGNRRSSSSTISSLHADPIVETSKKRKQGGKTEKEKATTGVAKSKPETFFATNADGSVTYVSRHPEKSLSALQAAGTKCN
ncbi:unnamed protein product, partial [Amoebophrya sp. A120]